MSHDHERRIADLTTRRNWLAGRIRAEEQRRRDAEQARLEAERRRREALEQQECYADDYRRGAGLFARYLQGTEEHRELILSNISRLFPDHELDRGHRDYAILPYDLKIALLGAYLGIAREREQYPRLMLHASDLQRHRYVYRHFAGPADLGEWRRRIPDIVLYLDADQQYDWTVEAEDGVHIVLTRHARLPRLLPLDRAWFVPGHVFFGLDPIKREPLNIPLESWSHTLLAGASGTGKSNAVHVLLANLFANLDRISHIHLIDGKDGVAFYRYKDTHPQVSVAWEPEDLDQTLDQLIARMHQRNTQQKQIGELNATDQFEVLLIDEIATYTAPPLSKTKEAKARYDRRMANLQTLARKARSTGIRLIITLQEPTTASIPTTMLNNLSTTTIAFALPTDAHATALFGALAGLPADPRTLPTGRALYWSRDRSIHTLVQFPFLADPLPPWPAVHPGAPGDAL